MDITDFITVLESDSRQIFRDIKKLKETFKVRLWIKKAADPGYSVIEATGRPENVKEVLNYINANLPRTVSMDMHPNDIGWIIGKSGDHIRTLQSTYHITAKFVQNTLHLRGRPSDIEKAKEAVKKRVQEKIQLSENKDAKRDFDENRKESAAKAHGQKKYKQLAKDARIRTKEFRQLKNSVKNEF